MEIKIRNNLTFHLCMASSLLSAMTRCGFYDHNMWFECKPKDNIIFCWLLVHFVICNRFLWNFICSNNGFTTIFIILWMQFYRFSADQNLLNFSAKFIVCYGWSSTPIFTFILHFASIVQYYIFIQFMKIIHLNCASWKCDYKIENHLFFRP